MDIGVNTNKDDTDLTHYHCHSGRYSDADSDVCPVQVTNISARVEEHYIEQVLTYMNCAIGLGPRARNHPSQKQLLLEP